MRLEDTCCGMPCPQPSHPLNTHHHCWPLSQQRTVAAQQNKLGWPHTVTRFVFLCCQCHRVMPVCARNRATTFYPPGDDNPGICSVCWVWCSVIIPKVTPRSPVPVQFADTGSGKGSENVAPWANIPTEWKARAPEQLAHWCPGGQTCLWQVSKDSMEQSESSIRSPLMVIN